VIAGDYKFVCKHYMLEIASEMFMEKFYGFSHLRTLLCHVIL